jgi:hypothetical protein
VIDTSETNEQLAGQTAADQIVALEAVEFERATLPTVGDERTPRLRRGRDALVSDECARPP